MFMRKRAMEAEQPQICGEDFRRENKNKEKESLQQQRRVEHSAGSFYANITRCQIVYQFLQFLLQDFLRRVEGRLYKLYEEHKDFYQSLTKDQALKDRILKRCDFAIINSNHSRQSRDYNISCPLALAKLYLSTVKREGKPLDSLAGYDSFRSLDVRDHLHLMSKTHPVIMFSTQTRARALQVLCIAIATAHVDGYGWTELFFEESLLKLEDFIHTLKSDDSRKAQILEELEQCRKTGCSFSSATVGEVQQLRKMVETLKSEMAELKKQNKEREERMMKLESEIEKGKRKRNRNKRNNEEGTGGNFKRTKLNKDPNEFDNDGKSIHSSGTSGIGTLDISVSQDLAPLYQVKAKPPKIVMISSEEHHQQFDIELSVADGVGRDFYFSVGSGRLQPLTMHKGEFIGKLNLSGLEAGKHQIKAYADKDGEHLLGQDEISVEDVFKDVSRLANNK